MKKKPELTPNSPQAKYELERITAVIYQFSQQQRENGSKTIVVSEFALALWRASKAQRTDTHE